MELQVDYRASKSIRLFASVGLTETEYVDFEGFDGNEFPNAPNHTVSIGGEYTHSKGFYLNLDLSHTASQFSNIANDGFSEVDAFTIANVRTGYEFESYSISAFANNLFDEKYVTSIDGFDMGSLALGGSPRIIGIQITAGF